MTTTPVTTGAAAGGRPDTAPAAPAPESLGTRFDIHWGRCGVLITAHGATDPADVGALGEYVQRCAGRCEWLILNLGDLDFVGPARAALSTLAAIADRCAAFGVELAVVPGPTVSRLLRSGECDRALPVHGSVAAALTAVHSRLWRHTAGS